MHRKLPQQWDHTATVSYTHLDVYKRQVQFFGENISHFTADEFKDVVVAVDEGKARCV